MVDYRRRRRRPAEDDDRFGKAGTGSWVDVTGTVVRLLSDDDDDARHQRIVLDVRAGRTILVAHNLDIAERVPAGLGDRLTVRGMFEWNDLGGLVHWTHRDPMGIEDGGYIEHRRKVYS